MDNKKKLVFPRHQYGPLCKKILSEFIDHHKLDKNLDLPCIGEKPDISLSKIFDIMLHSMGLEKRYELLKDAEEYLLSLPPSLR